MEHIDDADDERLGDYRQLKDTAARRRIEGDELFIAEGPVAIERLIASPHRVRSVLVSRQKYDRMAELLDPVDAPVYTVDKALLHDIVGFDLHRGAIAAADRLPHPTLDDIIDDHHRVAVLEGLNDPENLGAIARSARAFGIEALVLDPTCIDPYTRRTVRVSMGEILFLPTCRVASDGVAAGPRPPARRRVRHLGDDPGRRQPRHLGARRARTTGRDAGRRGPRPVGRGDRRRRPIVFGCRSTPTSTRSTSEPPPP